MAILKSPLLHFVVIGAAIFAIAPRKDDPRKVEVSSAQLVAFQSSQAAKEGVAALAPARAHEVEARAIEDEVLYREAIRLGLDRDDPIIRQRLIQKLLLLVEDLGGAARPPTEADLRAFFDRDPKRYAVGARVSLVHVFATQPDQLPAAEALPLEGIPSAGQPFPYPRQASGTREELSRQFGPAFGAAVFALDGDGWSAPVQSSFGWHRVRIASREAAHVPSFDEVKPALGFDYALDRRAEVVRDYLRKTVGQYQIDVDGKPLPSFSPTYRVAVRTAASAED
jgi:hypothetical protein